MKRTAMLRRSRIRPVSAKRRAAGPAWSQRKGELYARDGHRCIHCKSGRLSPQHVRKRSQGRDDSLDNLVTLCPGPGSCHDRADNVAAGDGKLHIAALGHQRFHVWDERSGERYVYHGLTGRYEHVQLYGVETWR